MPKNDHVTGLDFVRAGAYSPLDAERPADKMTKQLQALSLL